MIRPVRHAVAALATAGALVAGASPALAQATLDQWQSDIDSIDGRVTQLGPDYLRRIDLDDGTDLARRMTDGQLRYVMGQYAEAAVLLTEVVENDALRNQPGYSDALWLVGDSHFRTRNFLLARGYFEELVERNDPSWGLDAARRLLEISFELNEYAGLDALYRQLEQQRGGLPGAELAYVRGKALYFQERYDDAYTAFMSVPADAGLFVRARYFAAVIDARRGNLESAGAAFETLAETLESRDDLSAEEADVLELCHLALGRLAYEYGEWGEALVAYNQVDRGSPRYDAALYEIAWTFVRDGNYREAIYNLENLQVFASDRTFVPEAELLIGDLHMRLNEYDDAVETFEGVSDEYLPVERELSELMEEHDDPSAFFDALVNPAEGALDLPTLAEPWFENDRTVDRALRLVFDIATLEQEIATSELFLAELEGALGGTSGVNVFPLYQEGWGRALELEIGVIDARAALVEYESGRLAGSMDATARQRLQAARAERESLEAEYRALPRTLAELQEQVGGRDDSLRELELDVFRDEQEIARQRDELDGLRDILAEQVRRGERSVTTARRLRRELDRSEAYLDNLEREARRNRDDVRVRRARIGLADETGQAQRELRRRYVAALGAEAAILASARTSADTAVWQRIDTMRAQLDRTDARLAQFFEQMQGLVVEQTGEIVTMLDEERAALEVYRATLESYGADNRELTGEIAQQAFMGVQDRFSSLTLRANLGIIDVAWREKEEITERISDRFQERNRAIRVLDADFAEILDDR